MTLQAKLRAALLRWMCRPRSLLLLAAATCTLVALLRLGSSEPRRIDVVSVPTSEAMRAAGAAAASAGEALLTLGPTGGAGGNASLGEPVVGDKANRTRTSAFHTLIADLALAQHPWIQSFERMPELFGRPTNWMLHAQKTWGKQARRPTVDEFRQFNFLFFYQYPFKYASYFEPKVFPEASVLNHIPYFTRWFVTKKSFKNLANEAHLDFVPQMWDLPLSESVAPEESLVVAKAATHRGVHLVSRPAAAQAPAGGLAQRFVRRPVLVDGAKFDVGAYILFLGGSPSPSGGEPRLRTFVYREFSLRFCRYDYPGGGASQEPSDEELLAAPPGALFIDDKFRGFWNIPSLKPHAHLGAKAALREAIGADRMAAIDHGIAQNAGSVSMAALQRSARQLAAYPRGAGHFWELVRFDCTVDSDLRVYVVEINMSPNMYHHQPEPGDAPHDDVTWRSTLMDSTLRVAAAWASGGELASGDGWTEVSHGSAPPP